MKKNQINKRNLILLTGFAGVFSVVTALCAGSDRNSLQFSDAGLSSEELVSSMASSIETATMNVITESAATETETHSVTDEEASSILEETVYTITEYETPITMYTSDTVNVRTGAGTEYDKLGKLSWGSETLVTGETDNGWYEVSYEDTTAFIIGDYIVPELPGTPLVFVGDSRTVQLEMAVGDSDKAYIAKVGEGYSWFKNTALNEIPSYAGNGTTMIINFGVNDLSNAGKYISLINSNIDAWTNAGITVYYSSVTPVGESASVSNSQIEAFNARMQSELDPRVKWIDSYSFLSQTGFSTPDGLHYNSDTYRNLYSYYMSVISQV